MQCPGGGHLKLTAANDSATGSVLLDVEDTGRGLDDVDLPRIFDPFYTTKQEGYGVGLGLSTVKEIMHRHGGEVSIKKADSSGAIFRLALPAAGHA